MIKFMLFLVNFTKKREVKNLFLILEHVDMIIFRSLYFFGDELVHSLVAVPAALLKITSINQ